MVTTPESAPPTGGSATPRLVRGAVWLLPVHAVLLAVGTLTHQPDPGTAFDAYARYVTTGWFLASHLGPSILGAALGALGAVAVAAVLARGRTATAAAIAAALLVIGNVVTTAVFGAAAFAQPAIGRAHLRGIADAPVIDADVYGPALVLTAVVGLLFLLAGSVTLGTAVARGRPADRVLRTAGIAYAVLLPLFLLTGFLLTELQVVSAALAAVAAVVIARGLGRD